ncbi:MAG: hypothetical protein V4692_00250 [Bdellovibrionota bacterium]
MTLFKTLTIASACALTIGTIGCASNNKRTAAAPAPTPAQQAVSQLETDRSTYVSQTQSRIDTIESFANDLEARAESTDKVKAKKMQNASEDMNSLLEEVRKELADVTSAAPQNWIDEKRDVERTLERAESNYSNSVRLLQ